MAWNDLGTIYLSHGNIVKARECLNKAKEQIYTTKAVYVEGQKRSFK
jgi:Flp pilus assembly protein TadD